MLNGILKLIWTYITKRPSKFSTIIYSTKIISETLSDHQWNTFLSGNEEISDDMYSSWEYRNKIDQNDAGSIFIGMSIDCFIVTFPTLKWHFSVKWLIDVLSDILLKSSSPFIFFPQYAVPLLDNVIKTLPSHLKAKLTVDESLDFSLSWVSFVCNVWKSYELDLTHYFLFLLFIEWNDMSAFCRTQNLF